MDLSKMNDAELQTVLAFTNKLGEQMNADLEQAERQAAEFARARNENKRGKVQPNDAESVEIQKSVRSWLRRTNRIPK